MNRLEFLDKRRTAIVWLVSVALLGVSAPSFAVSEVNRVLDSGGGWMDGASYHSVSAIGQGHPVGRTISGSSVNFAGFLHPDDSPINTNNFAPILASIGSKVVLAGQVLSFTARTYDPNGTLPTLSAGPLPPGATVQLGQQNGTNRTGTFSWTPSGAQVGVYPVLFSATDGELTSQEIVVLYVGASGDGTNNPGGMPDALANYSLITNLSSVSSGNATVQWGAVDGITYRVYYSNQPVTSNMAWHLLGTVVAAGASGSIVDSSFGASPGRTYTIAFGNDTPSSRGAWRGNKDALSGQRFTLAGPAVESDRSFGGVMGSNLAATLTGDASGLADRIHVLQPGGTWRILWLDEAKRWREALDNSYSEYVLPAGLGFMVERPSHAPANLVLSGKVGNDGSKLITLSSGWNLISLSEGKALPLRETFAPGGPIGGASLEAADQIHIMGSNGAWTTLMYVQGWGPPYDGNWLNMNEFQIYTAPLKPGQAYYYYRQGGSMNVGF
ncbi:MAG: Ig domain-containing protein [Kiritimatiellae bacterium]|nr:Ig domain-containing protein [Kiritimatiellia bacterium]